MNLHTLSIHTRARIHELPHARTHAHNYTRSQLVGHCQRNETYTHHDYTPLTHLESSDCVCAWKASEWKWERKKTATTAKCSVSIINSDDSKGISFVFKCFNLLFAILFHDESAVGTHTQLFRIVNSISKITKVCALQWKWFLVVVVLFRVFEFFPLSFILSSEQKAPASYSSHKFFLAKSCYNIYLYKGI